MKKYKAKVLYCGYLENGSEIEVTKKEYDRIQKTGAYWIARKGIVPNSPEEIHLFGVEKLKEVLGKEDK